MRILLSLSKWSLPSLPGLTSLVLGSVGCRLIRGGSIPYYPPYVGIVGILWVNTLLAPNTTTMVSLNTAAHTSLKMVYLKTKDPQPPSAYQPLL